MLSLYAGYMFFYVAFSFITVTFGAHLVVDNFSFFQMQGKALFIMWCHGHAGDIGSDVCYFLRATERTAGGKGAHDGVVPVACAEISELLDYHVFQLTGNLRITAACNAPSFRAMTGDANRFIESLAVFHIGLQLDCLFEFGQVTLRQQGQ